MERELIKKQKLKDFNYQTKQLLNEKERETLFLHLKKYQQDLKLSVLIQWLKILLDTPAKLDLLQHIRSFVPPSQVNEYDQQVPYQRTSRPLKSRSLENLSQPKLLTLAPDPVGPWLSQQFSSVADLRYQQIVDNAHPSAYHGAITDDRDVHTDDRVMVTSPDVLVRGGKRQYGMILSHAEQNGLNKQQHYQPTHTETSVIRSPPVLALHIHVDQYETLGLFIRGGKEHGLAIYVSEVEPHSAADRGGLIPGDKILEVNSVSCQGLACSSAVTVLTGSSQLQVKVQRLSKIPEYKTRKERLAWQDVVNNRLIYTSHGELPYMRSGTSWLTHAQERKINLTNSGEAGTFLGFNIRGGAEFDLPVFVSRVDPGGLAEQHGLMCGDQLLEINGIDVTRATHAQCAEVLKSRHSLILTVKDVGMYPAHKDHYTEYKWVDVHSGQVVTSRSYKKNNSVESGRIQSVPVIGPHQADDLSREQFADSQVDSTIATDSNVYSSIYDAIPTHIHLPGSPVPSRASAPPVRSQRLHVIGQSINNLRSSRLYSASHHDVRPHDVRPHDVDAAQQQEHHQHQQSHDSTLNRYKSHSAYDLNTAVVSSSAASKRRQCYVYNRNHPNSYFRSHEALHGHGRDTDIDLQPAQSRKSVLETALEFQEANAMTSLVDEEVDVPIVTSQDGSDVIVSSKSNSAHTSPSMSPAPNFHLRRKKSDAKSSLGVKALEMEAKVSQAELLKSSSDVRTDADKSTKENDNRKQKAKAKLSFKEKLFGSKARNKDGSKKLRKARPPLNTTSAERVTDLNDVENEARRLLNNDEIEAIKRHLVNYGSSHALSGLLSRLFAILDTRDRLTLCDVIRPVIFASDRDMFDFAVDAQREKLDVEAKMKSRTKAQVKPVSRSASSQSRRSNSSSDVIMRNKKRPAPLPPAMTAPVNQSVGRREVTARLHEYRQHQQKQQVAPVKPMPAVHASRSSPILASASTDAMMTSSPSPAVVHRRKHFSQSLENIQMSSASNRHVVVVEFHDDYDLASRDVASHDATSRAVNKVDAEVQTNTDSLRSRSTPALYESTRVPEESSFLQSSVITLKGDDAALAVKLSPRLSVSLRKPESESSPMLRSRADSHLDTHHDSTDSSTGLLRHSSGDKEVIYIDKNNIRLSGYDRQTDRNSVEVVAAAPAQTAALPPLPVVTASTVPVAPPPPPIPAHRQHDTAHVTSRPRKDVKEPPAVTSQAMALAAILTQSVQTSVQNLKPVSKKPPDFPATLDHAVSQNDVAAVDPIGDDVDTFATDNQAMFRRRRTSDDVISVSESTRTTASSVKGKRDLADCHYVDSDAMFPVYEASESGTLRRDTELPGQTPAAGTENEQVGAVDQSDDVLQATATLDFLDCLDTESNQTSPRTEPAQHENDDESITKTTVSVTMATTDVNKQNGGMEVSNISGCSSGSGRAPPQFFAPPPPSEPPPPLDDDTDESRSCASCCSCGSRSPEVLTSQHARRCSHDNDKRPIETPQRDVEVNNDGKEGLKNTKKSETNIMEILDKIEQSTMNVVSNGKTTSNESSPRKSWLYSNMKQPVRSDDAQHLTPDVNKEHVVSEFFTPPDLASLPANDRDTRLVYIDKNFPSLGLSIAGGMDSKAPEIRVKAVLPGGAAAAAGSLKVGMQLVSLDGISLVDVTHMRAAITIKRSFDNKLNKRMLLEVRE